jgi:hypothetical protein
MNADSSWSPASLPFRAAKRGSTTSSLASSRPRLPKIAGKRLSTRLRMVVALRRSSASAAAVAVTTGPARLYSSGCWLPNLTSFTSEPFAGSEQRDRSPGLFHQIKCRSAHPAPGHEHPIARMQNPPRALITEPRPISFPMAAAPHVIATAWAPRPIARAPDIAGARTWPPLDARRRRGTARSDRRVCFGLGRHDCGGERRNNRGGQKSP